MKQKMMEMFLHFLLLLHGALTILVLIEAQDQSGFTSIDCGGLPENSNYSEKDTGINYISDAQFINTGESKRLPLTNIIIKQELEYVRSFPTGVRNCYRINVTSDTKYLIRATFYYGNYDNLNNPPQFDLHFGANVWDTVKFTNVSRIVTSEIIYTPSLDYIQPCLVNTGKGTPFISVIELRTLNNTAYVTYAAKSSVLSYFFRFDMGSITNLEYRYKDDVFDRYWFPNEFVNWKRLSTSLNNDDLAQNGYEPPAVVMSTAATPVNVSAPLQMVWNADNVNDRYYIYLHFNEVEKLAENETRSFNITVNGDLFYGPEIPVYRSVDTIYSKTPRTGAKNYIISLFKAENSTHPPTLNAIEVYKVIDFSLSETEQGDVDAITNIKNAYGVARDWQGDPCGPVNYMWEGLNCTIDGNNIPRITSLNLSSSGLTGEIASSISNLTTLQYLDLSNNSLSGPLPDFLTQLESLKTLNLGKNNLNLTGLVSSGLLERSKEGLLLLILDPNPCEPDSCNQKKSKKFIPLVASIAGIFVLLVLVSAAAIICARFKKRKPQDGNSHLQSNTPNESQLESKHRQYTYDDVSRITNNFDSILGRGGFGTVYYGLIDDTEVAVKMLSKSSVHGFEQFLAEVKFLMRVHHKNLTSLIGYCNEENNIGLIYEYMANGNLDELLSGKNKAKFLTWADRLRIAVDAAQGLEYLHNGCKPPIIHRDVKSTNILLNESFQAKLADFGLSKNFPTDGGTHLTTVVAGTPGYLDHEYMTSNRLTEKSDVYSFGVVLLEIITSQPAITKSPDKTHISQWVRSMFYNGDIKNIVDSRLQQDFDTNSAWKAVDIGMACVSTNSSDRPNMSEVMNGLKECLAEELARKRVGRGKTIKESSIELVPLNLEIELGPQAR